MRPTAVINGEACPASSVILVGPQNCRPANNDVEGSVCAETATGNGYCSYTVGPSACARCSLDVSACSCFATESRYENYCENGAFTDPNECEADSHCHWGPGERSECVGMLTQPHVAGGAEGGYYMPNAAQFCVSEQLITLMSQSGTGATLVLARVSDDGTSMVYEHANSSVALSLFIVCALISIAVAFFGQFLAAPTVILITSTTSFFLAFFLSHAIFFSAAGAAASSNFMPCTFPLVCALVISVGLSVAVGVLLYKITWLSTVVFGLAIGGNGAFFMRSIITSFSTARTNWLLDYYPLFIVIVAVLVASLSVLCITSDGRKSYMLMAGSALAGGYGLAVSLTALIDIGADRLGVNQVCQLPAHPRYQPLR